MFTVSETPTVVVNDEDGRELFSFTTDDLGNVVLYDEYVEPEYLPMYITGLKRMAELLGCEEYDEVVE